jgi:hypothetical protein
MKPIPLVACALLTLTACSARMAPTDLPDEAVRHVVAFKYAERATPAQIQEVTDAFADLPNSIPGILSFEHGVTISPEGLDRGFTHVYLVTFEDAAARDAYLPHPEHQAFGQLLDRLGILEEVFVVDYSP